MCFHFVGTGISIDAAEYLVKKGIYGVGVDGPSLDPGNNTNFDAHRTLFKNNTFGIENLNLEEGKLPGNYANLLTFRISHLTQS